MDKSGLLLLNKPEGISSFDCIRSLRRTFRTASNERSGVVGAKIKIGHAGTLDPAASGLMLMLFGTACKQAQTYSKLDKTYVAEITLGATSSTGDREGTIVERRMYNVEPPTLDVVRDTLYAFVGTITQVPSMYSAIKINGQEAYKRAWRGESVEMPSREVRIYELRIINNEYPKLEVEVRCSSGTYIRTLAQDIGEKLGTGAYLSKLVRIKVGDYTLEQAVELDASPDLIASSIR